MCGRFVRKTDLREVALIFKAATVESSLAPSFNIAPRQPVAVIMEKGQRKIVSMQWGLIPHWATDDKIASKLINARGETVMEKPSFRNSFKNRRCLIIADGFYEWQSSGPRKKPFYICMKDEMPFGMAGLYDQWISNDGKAILTCTIVTTEANEIMKPIHHRMPIIIDPENYDLWLSLEETETSKLVKLLRPSNPDLLKTYEVSLLVNSPANNSQDCILPAV